MENVERWRSTATEPRKPRSPPAIFGKLGNLRQCRASGRAPLGLQKVLAGSEFPGLRPGLLNPTPSGSQVRQSWAPSAKMAKFKGTFCLDRFPGLRPAPSNRTPLGHENGKVGAFGQDGQIRQAILAGSGHLRGKFERIQPEADASGSPLFRNLPLELESSEVHRTSSAKLGAFGEDGRIRQAILAGSGRLRGKFERIQPEADASGSPFPMELESSEVHRTSSAKLGAFGEDGQIRQAILAGSGRLRGNPERIQPEADASGSPLLLTPYSYLLTSHANGKTRLALQTARLHVSVERYLRRPERLLGLRPPGRRTEAEHQRGMVARHGHRAR